MSQQKNLTQNSTQLTETKMDSPVKSSSTKSTIAKATKSNINNNQNSSGSRRSVKVLVIALYLADGIGMVIFSFHQHQQQQQYQQPVVSALREDPTLNLIHDDFACSSSAIGNTADFSKLLHNEDDEDEEKATTAPEEEQGEEEEAGAEESGNKKYHVDSDIFDDVDPIDAENLVPIAPETSSGVYLVEDKITKNPTWVFKPCSEEDMRLTNGEGYLREYAAYTLDDGFAGVPETKITVIDGKLGSLQRFVQNSQDCEDLGFSLFSTEDIHRIGVLDIRICNQDSHSGNLMRNNDSGKLVPIDHGMSFPSAFDSNGLGASFEWLRYPQAKEPFSKETLEYIANIDLDQDIRKLQQVGLDKGSQLSVWMTTTLLKLGAANGLTLYDIASLIQREGDRSSPSELEDLINKCTHAEHTGDSSLSSSDFLKKFTDALNLVKNKM